MPLTTAELTKLVNTAIEAARKCGDGADAAEEGRAVDALRVLAQQQVTTELLSETEAGKRLKKLNKHSSSKVAEASAAAVEAWKECIRKEHASKPASSSKAPSQPAAPQPGTSFADRQGSLPDGSQGDNDGSGELNRAASNKLILEPAKTGEDTRDKIRKILAEALALALSADVFGDPCTTAVSVETALFVQSGGVNQKYKAKFRSLSFNLKDPKNPDLRARVLSGDIPGDVLVTLSAEEMASSDMRAKNDQIREHMKNESVRGNNSMASTDMFQCGKCKQRKCTYYQLQTRSADEPMTTFVTCTNCGSRWKFC